MNTALKSQSTEVDAKTARLLMLADARTARFELEQMMDEYRDTVIYDRSTENFSALAGKIIIRQIKAGMNREIACRSIAVPLKSLDTWLYLGQQGASTDLVSFRYDLLRAEAHNAWEANMQAEEAIANYNPAGIKLLERADRIADQIGKKFDGSIAIAIEDTMLASMTDGELRLYSQSNGAIVPARFGRDKQQLLTGLPIETKEIDGTHEPTKE